MENGIQGILSERTKYIMENHPKLMNSIVDYITCKDQLSEADKKLLGEIITKFKIV